MPRSRLSKIVLLSLFVVIVLVEESDQHILRSRGGVESPCLRRCLLRAVKRSKTKVGRKILFVCLARSPITKLQNGTVKQLQIAIPRIERSYVFDEAHCSCINGSLIYCLHSKLSSERDFRPSEVRYSNVSKSNAITEILQATAKIMMSTQKQTNCCLSVISSSL